MRLNKLSISGYRNFDNFIIEGSNTDGLIVLAGQNGTGKSTILEIIYFLLSNMDINQLNMDIAQGITKDITTWSITASFSESEIDYLKHRIYSLDQTRFSGPENVKEDFMKILKLDKNRYFFTRTVTIKPAELFNAEPVRTTEFTDSSGSRIAMPSSFEVAAKNKLFCGFFKAIENIELGGVVGIRPTEYPNTIGQVISGQDDIRNRNTRTTVNVGSLLNNLASKALWESIKATKPDLSELKKTLDEMNQLIPPLEMFYDEKLVEEEGRFVFSIRNLKTKRTYPLNFASSGERQMIGLVGTFKYWKDSKFKSLLLFDEPDSSLHPEFVSRFSEFINTLLTSEDSDFTCLVATHSPDLIYWNSQNVYQISPDSKSINKVSNLTQRVEMLKSLGKGFDLAYLIKKVVYVEGVDSSKNRLEDCQIYQSLVDKQKQEVVFIAAGYDKDSGEGSKSKVIKRSKIFNQLISSLDAPENLKVFALIDSDNEDINKSFVIKTPYKCVENLFLYDSALLYDVILQSYGIELDIEDCLSKLDSNYKTNRNTVDGKNILTKLYQLLYQGKKDILNEKGGYKGFQSLILKELNIEKYPEDIKAFLIQLKK